MFVSVQMGVKLSKVLGNHQAPASMLHGIDSLEGSIFNLPKDFPSFGVLMVVVERTV